MFGIVEGRDIANRYRIEDGDIRDHSRPENAAVIQVNARGRLRCHLADRFFKREEVLLSNVLAENPRKRTPRARVRLRFRELAVFGLRARIRTDADERM